MDNGYAQAVSAQPTRPHAQQDRVVEKPPVRDRLDHALQNLTELHSLVDQIEARYSPSPPTPPGMNSSNGLKPGGNFLDPQVDQLVDLTSSLMSRLQAVRDRL